MFEICKPVKNNQKTIRIFSYWIEDFVMTSVLFLFVVYDFIEFPLQFFGAPYLFRISIVL